MTRVNESQGITIDAVLDRMERRPPGRGDYGRDVAPRRRAVVPEDSENLQIERSRATPEAAAPHPFRLAAWADADGDPRCRTCGAKERVDAQDDTLSCEGTAAAAGPAPVAGGRDEPAAEDAGGRAGGDVEALPAPGDAAPAGEEPPVSVQASYSDGVMHAHLGAGPHFHVVQKGAGETGAVTDAAGVELAVKHAHAVIDGALKPGSEAGATPAARDDAAAAAPADPPAARATQKYTDAQLAKMAGDGRAIPVRDDGDEIVSGAFPIEDAADLDEAVKGYGAAKNAARAMAHITARAKALGATDRLPDDWEGSTRPRPAVRKSLYDLIGLLVQPDHIGDYVIVKAEAPLEADPEHRVTIGVVYPVGREDAHGDKMTKDEVRKAAWGWAKKGFSASGTQHRSGTQGAGQVLESWLWPDGAPDWTIARGDGTTETVKSGDWLAAVLWDEPTWGDIKKGKYTGYSLQGMGKRIPE